MELAAGSPLCCPEVPDGWGGVKPRDCPPLSFVSLLPQPLLTGYSSRATQLSPAWTTKAPRDTGRVGARLPGWRVPGGSQGSALTAGPGPHSYLLAQASWTLR